MRLAKVPAVKPYADEIVTFSMMLLGYKRAVQRFHAATTEPARPSSAYVPLFEALNWAVALDDRTGGHWRPHGGEEPIKWKWRQEVPNGGYVDGIRFARNRIHHQWSDALLINDQGRSEAQAEWVWRPSDELPSGRDDRGIDNYSALLAGAPVHYALDVLAELYEWIVLRLEPAAVLGRAAASST